MIQFKNRAVKIIFYIIFSFLTIISLLIVLIGYFNPTPDMSSSAIVMSMFFMYLFPSLLLVILFTQPIPRQKNPEKRVRLGLWIPISAFLFLSLLSIVLMSLLSISRCKKITSEGKLWNCDFAGRDFSGMDLHAASFVRAQLTGANFSETDLSNTEFNGAKMQKVNLTNADLSNSDLQMADLSEANMAGVVLDGASIRLANLVDAVGLTGDMLKNLRKWDGVLLQDSEQMASELFPVCNGQPIEKAAEHNSTNFINSMMLLNSDGGIHSIADRFGRFYFYPASVTNTVFVACFSEVQKVVIRTCAYDDGTSVPQSMQRVDISIYKAKSGELIETVTLYGPRPDSCPEKKVANGDYPEIMGDPPFPRDIFQSLERNVNKDRDLPALNLP